MVILILAVFVFRLLRRGGMYVEYTVADTGVYKCALVDGLQKEIAKIENPDVKLVLGPIFQVQLSALFCRYTMDTLPSSFHCVKC